MNILPFSNRIPLWYPCFLKLELTAAEAHQENELVECRIRTVSLSSFFANNRRAPIWTSLATVGHQPLPRIQQKEREEAGLWLSGGKWVRGVHTELVYMFEEPPLGRGDVGNRMYDCHS